MPSPFPTRTRRYTVKAERQLGSSFLFGFPRFFTFDVTPGLFTLTGRLRTNVFPLENGRLYRLSVVATNAAGDSDQSLPFVFGRPLGAPGAPRRLEATSDENQASTLTWTRGCRLPRTAAPRSTATSSGTAAWPPGSRTRRASARSS